VSEDTGHWRDDRELPIDELTRAMGTYSTDGQLDDATGGNAGAEAAFGHEPPAVTEDDLDADERRLAGADERRLAGPGQVPAHDPDPDSELGRALRPSPEGRTGPG